MALWNQTGAAAFQAMNCDVSRRAALQSTRGPEQDKYRPDRRAWGVRTLLPGAPEGCPGAVVHSTRTRYMSVRYQRQRDISRFFH